MANYDVVADFSAIENLIKRLENPEEIITRYMQTLIFPIAKDNLIEVTPRSNENKRHARDSQPYKMIAENLGFSIVTKGGASKNKNSFGYLVFPDEGRGPSNPVAQKFTERSREKTLEEVIPMMKEHLINYLGGK